jgi:hypothetical protein
MAVSEGHVDRERTGRFFNLIVGEASVALDAYPNSGCFRVVAVRDKITDNTCKVFDWVG